VLFSSAILRVGCALLYMGAAGTSAATLPPNIAEYTGQQFDGKWTGSGAVTTGSCASASLRWTVQGPAISTPGLVDGVTFGARGSSYSKAVGVIHENKTVEVVLYAAGDRGRTSIAKGRIEEGGKMKLKDEGTTCSYEYELSR
jgi:hypothetical protein